MFNLNSTKSPSYNFPTHIVSISALFFIPENDFSFNKKVVFSSETPVLRKDTRVQVLSYGLGVEGKMAKIVLENGTIGYVAYKDSLAPLQGVPQFLEVSKSQKYQANPTSPEVDWKTQEPNKVYDDPHNGTYTVHIELENVVDFNGGKDALKQHLEKARIDGTREILSYVRHASSNITDLLYNFYLFSVAEEWFVDIRPCSTLRVAVAIPKRFLFVEEKEIANAPEEELEASQQPPQQQEPPQKRNTPPVPELDIKNCIIDTETRIRDLASIKLQSEINKWVNLNRQYERNRPKIESDLFTRSLMNVQEIQDANMRILLGYDKLTGKTDKQKLQIYVSIARSLDWAKFLGLAAQCLSRPIPLDELTALMDKYKEARRFIDQILSSTICNPYLKNGFKIINGFELPIIKAYNPNEVFARELETAFVKIMQDLISFGIKKSLEAAAKACATDPNANFNLNSSGINPLNLENSDQDPAVSDLLDQIYNNSGQPLTEEERENIKNQFKNMIDDITSCVTFKEICSLYKGNTVNDEVYQAALSIIKRKYPQFVSIFSTREQIGYFFKTVGSKIDLSLCDDALSGDLPLFTNDGTNLLCDDGSLRKMREQILADRGLTPELINELLDTKKKDEIKALEDVLKLLDSENPFDFSQVPDLGCKVFPSGETIAPSMQSFTSMLNSMVRSIYDSFDAEAADWYKTTYSSVDPNRPKILEFDSSTGEVSAMKNISISEDKTKSIKANSGKVDPAKQEADSKLSSGVDETKYPSYIYKKSINNISVGRTAKVDKEEMTFSVSLDGDLQQRMDLDFIQVNLKQSIQAGEASLSLFAKKVWSQILGIYGTELGRIATNITANNVLNLPNEPAYRTLKPMIGFLLSIDTFLRSNVPDSEELKNSLKDAYLVLGLDDTQQSNGFFAAENGAAIYLAICENLKLPATRAFITSLGIQQAEIDAILAQYEIIKGYYRSILKLKINYPDFDIQRTFGLESVGVGNATFPSIIDGVAYDIQKLEVQKNKRSHIKITEISKAPPAAQRVLDAVGLDYYDGVNKSKDDIFYAYLKKKIDTYGFSEDGVLLDTQDNFGFAYRDLYQRMYDKVIEKTLSSTNKFGTLKDLRSPYYTATTLTGSGQPYTQYLKLVLPQTPEQKLCNVRPHYLDIDAIKEGVLQEKANNICIERAADSRSLGNDPIPSSQIMEMETSSTQDAMLRGMYRLAVRLFLHDLLLRGIIVFGHYDPQSLRNEPMFVSFMAKMTESEMRGMDNTFFNMLTNFLVKESDDKSDLKKMTLFRDLVENELMFVVLPKLAKRIIDDTNYALLHNKPKDNPITLVNVLEQIPNYQIFEVKNNSVHLLLNLDYQPNTAIAKKQFKVSQKIYESRRARNTSETLSEFLASDDYQFLFKYLLPATQILNDIFITSCLSTTTRKQIVNAFKGTKRDIISTCKIIQTNGQDIQRNANSSQDVVDDPMQLIAGFLLQMAFKTPINVLKGIAESTEPNIALSSMAFKIARAFVPELPSFLIPAVSIPLGTIPTPITCPLPFINPILAIAYFATLAWYDDKPLDEMVNNAARALENSITKPKVICGEDVINQDKFYQDKKTPIGSEYNSKRDASTSSVTELTEQQLSSQLEQDIDAFYRRKLEEKALIDINNILTSGEKTLVTEEQIKTRIREAITQEVKSLLKNEADFNNIFLFVEVAAMTKIRQDINEATKNILSS
jgi:hypothetical protein